MATEQSDEWHEISHSPMTPEAAIASFDAVDTAALDIAIGQQLFGMTELECGQPHHLGARCWSIPNGPPHLNRAIRYSTTGDGMLQVIEAVRERGWYMLLEVDDAPHSVRISTGDEKWDSHWTRYHDSLPTAVALAALSAVEA